MVSELKRGNMPSGIYRVEGVARNGIRDGNGNGSNDVDLRNLTITALDPTEVGNFGNGIGGGHGQVDPSSAKAL